MGLQQVTLALAVLAPDEDRPPPDAEAPVVGGLPADASEVGVAAELVLTVEVSRGPSGLERSEEGTGDAEVEFRADLHEADVLSGGEQVRRRDAGSPVPAALDGLHALLQRLGRVAEGHALDGTGGVGAVAAGEEEPVVVREVDAAVAGVLGGRTAELLEAPVLAGDGVDGHGVRLRHGRVDGE